MLTTTPCHTTNPAVTANLCAAVEHNIGSELLVKIGNPKCKIGVTHISTNGHRIPNAP